MGWFLLKYPIKVKCDNCGKESTINVKKGMTVKEFARDKLAKCPNCGCTADIKEYKTQWYE